MLNAISVADAIIERCEGNGRNRTPASPEVNSRASDDPGAVRIVGTRDHSGVPPNTGSQR
jgi:hypothetical protein